MKKILLVMFVLFLIFGCTENNDSNSTETNTSEMNATDTNESYTDSEGENYTEEYTQSIDPSLYNSSIGLNYRDATFDAIPIDTAVVFRGLISQVINDNEIAIQTGQRCETTIVPEGQLFAGLPRRQCVYENNSVILLFQTRPMILQNDTLLIFGRYSGSTKRSMLNSGQEITIPSFTVDYYKIGTGNSCIVDALSQQCIDGAFVDGMFKTTEQINNEKEAIRKANEATEAKRIRDIEIQSKIYEKQRLREEATLANEKKEYEASLAKIEKEHKKQEDEANRPEYIHIDGD